MADTCTPNQEMFSKAHIGSREEYQQLYNESVSAPEKFWEEQARNLLSWYQDFREVRDTSLPEGMISWFLGGRLNASFNCIDRYVGTRSKRLPSSGRATSPTRSDTSRTANCSKVPFYEPRDIDLDLAMTRERPYCPAEHMDSEDSLFLLYTSGSTGNPKGNSHSTDGYLLYTALTHKYVFDYQEDDVYACVADVGWITGPSYIVYGPLLNGATTVMFESTPLYPDAGRYWEMVEKHRLTQFYTAPTALRAIAREGDEYLRKYDRSSLRVLGSVGDISTLADPSVVEQLIEAREHLNDDCVTQYGCFD